jgi:GT2 family glycosyltransferase
MTASRPPEDGEQRRTVLLVADNLDATQAINFVRPLRDDPSYALTGCRSQELASLAGGMIPAWLASLDPRAVILSRCLGDHVQPLVAACKAQGVPLVYHLDDDLLAVPREVGEAKFQFYNNPRRLAALRALILDCDLVYASTPQLAEQLTSSHSILSPMVTGDIACAVDPALFATPTPALRPTIGYMATSSHGDDFQLVSGAIEALLADIPHLQLEFFGTIGMPNQLDVRFPGQVTLRPPVRDYDAFLRELGGLGWWVGLAPLQPGRFNACKTETKWVEYTFAGIPTVASDHEVYRRSRSRGGSLLIPQGQDWAAALGGLIANRSMRSDLIGRAREVAAERYTLERLRKQVRHVIEMAREVAGAARETIALPRFRPPPPGPRPKEFQRWSSQFDTLGEMDCEAILQRSTSQMAAPLVSVILVARADGPEPGPADVFTTLDSLIGQIGVRWEVITGPGVAADAAGDDRLKFANHQDLPAALAEAAGEVVVFVHCGDALAPHALAILAATFDSGDASTPPRLAFSDTATMRLGEEDAEPDFKPGWNRELFYGQDYVSRFFAVPRDTAQALANLDGQASGYGLVLSYLRLHGDAEVRHLPYVLCRTNGAERPAAASPADAAALRRHFAETIQAPAPEVLALKDGDRRIVWPRPAGDVSVSLIVPTRDRVDLLKGCVDSILRVTAYRAFEIVIVDNDSVEPATLSYLAEVGAQGPVRVLRAPGEFNFSALNNLAVATCSSDVVGLVNNDIEAFQPDWLAELVSHAVRPEVGAAGPMLFYGDDTVQHAGVVLGVGGIASHIFKSQPGFSPGYQGRMRVAREFSAVTGACLLMRRTAWDLVGGMDEGLPVAFNDIDLCLRLRSQGLKVVWTPFAQLKHLESATRGPEQDAQRRARFLSDQAAMISRWGGIIARDPYYNPNLSLRSVECRPAFPPRAPWPWWQAAGAPPSA